MKKLTVVLMICLSGFIFNPVYSQICKTCDLELIDQLEDFSLKDGMFIKSFSVSLPRYSKTNRHPVDSISIDLAGKSTYWIVLVSSTKKTGLAKLLMYDVNNTLMVTLENKYKLTLDASQIKTDKPATYYFKVSFEKGYEGCAGFAIYYIPGYKIKNKK
jgi:hypothetical protein